MKRCAHESRRLSERWDAYYCFECKVWLEGCCSEGGCEYCTDRPPDASKEPEDFLDLDDPNEAL